MNTYDFFDDIVFMYSNTSCDLTEKENYFKNHNIPVRYLYTENVLQGWCSLEAIYQAYNNGCDNLLLFQQDFIETNTFSEKVLLNVIKYMQNNENCDTLYLGYSLFLTTFCDCTKVTNNIIKHNPIKSNVVCYTRKAMKKILDNFEDYIGIVDYDVYIATFINLNNYCVCPMLFETKIRSHRQLSRLQHSFVSINWRFLNKYVFLMIISIVMNYVKRMIVSKISLQNGKIDYYTNNKY